MKFASNGSTAEGRRGEERRSNLQDAAGMEMQRERERERGGEREVERG